MSCESIVHDLIFKASKTSWEAYPFSNDEKGSHLYFFKHPEYKKLDHYHLRSHIKLNVRTKLHELYPDLFPNLDTIGDALKRQLKVYGVVNFISAEDSSNEGEENFWASIESIYIPHAEYEAKIRKVNRMMLASSEKKLDKSAMEDIPDEEEVKIAIEQDESEDVKVKEKQKIQSPDNKWKLECECTISKEIMNDPVIGPDGHTYERSVIEAHLKIKPISPITEEPMTIESLTPNRALKTIIDAWRDVLVSEKY